MSRPAEAWWSTPFVEYGRLDMLVNNAGLSVVAKFSELHDLELFRRVMDINFYGALYCTYHALPHLLESRGRLVNVSSLGGKLAIPYNSVLRRQQVRAGRPVGLDSPGAGRGRRQRHRHLPLLGGDRVP